MGSRLEVAGAKTLADKIGDGDDRERGLELKQAAPAGEPTIACGAERQVHSGWRLVIVRPVAQSKSTRVRRRIAVRTASPPLPWAQRDK